MSTEFEKLKGKVAIAGAIIQRQAALISDLNAKLAAVPVAVVVEVTEADYAALSKVLDDAAAAVAASAEAAEEVAPAEPVPAVDAPIHPAFA